MKKRGKRENRSILAWCLYDVGNSAFATTVMAAVLPVYYQSAIASGQSEGWALTSWGYGSSVALLCTALVTPLVGTYVDSRPVKKRCLGLFSLLGIGASAALAATTTGMWLQTLALLVLGTVGYGASEVCYDALLPHLAPRDQLDRVSSMGYGAGYLGGGILLALNLAMILRWGAAGVRLSFLSVALWWGLFTLPALAWIAEPPVEHQDSAGPRRVFSALGQTWRELQSYPDALRFLAAFWLYNDGIGTIIRMAAVFGAAMGIGQAHLVGALLVTQFVGVPFAMIFASLAEGLGSKRALTTALWWYVAIALGAAFISQNWHFWAMAIAVGMVQGGSQAISRSLFASMVPPGQSGRFFGLYNVSSKFAGILGPFLCGLVVQLSGSLKLSLTVVALDFLLGLLLLSWVDVGRGRRRAQQGPTS